jgi:hypothetical protein
MSLSTKLNIFPAGKIKGDAGKLDNVTVATELPGITYVVTVKTA